jgi:hypothetical protein
MRSRKPAIPLSLLIALLPSLVFALSACEQTGFTPSVQSRSTDQPTVDSESSVREMSQPPSESTRGASEIAGEPVGNEPVPGGMLTVTFLNVGQGSSALIRLPNGGNVLIDGGPRDGGFWRAQSMLTSTEARRIPQMSDLSLLRAVATRLLGVSSSYSPKCLEGRRSRKPHSPGPTPTSVPDSDRLPSGTVTLLTERVLSMAATDWGERTPPSRKRITRSGRPYICLHCPIRQLNLSTALSYAPLKSGLTSSKVSWVGFTIAIQHIHP